ncbi:hypothetical protein PIB30_105616, partial [Stylosanthes scabra]|nr:hypothetical protein [Stylosanthes scabra]
MERPRSWMYDRVHTNRGGLKPSFIKDIALEEGEDIALEEELARQAGRIYLRWDGGN